HLPPFLVIGGKLHQGKKAIAGEGGGSLGALYDPFRLEYDAEEGFKIPALQLSSDLTPDRLGERQQLMRSLDVLERQIDLLRAARSIDEYRAQAFGLLTSPSARVIFDLSRESPALIDRYGRTRFG